MLPVVYFVFLISCSAQANNENEALSGWRESDTPFHSETLHSRMADDGNDLMKVRPNIILCCVCQQAVRQAKNKVYHKIQEKINKVCSKYIVAIQKICIQRAVRYRDILLNIIFPGGSPRATCSKAQFCS